MLSRSQQKLLRKLAAKKYRQQYRLFVAEGRKVVGELLAEGLIPEMLIATPDSDLAEKATIVSPEELKGLTNLEAADEVIGVFPFPEIAVATGNTIVVLDGIKDPGNLGTIIRTCDWFGVSEVYCSVGSTDIYNSKTVQSTMGSIARVKVSYISNEEIHSALILSGAEVLCADMNGQSFTDFKPAGKTAIVMGSESHGPSDFWKEKAKAITIPRKGSSKTESLNVGVAAGILIAHLSS